MMVQANRVNSICFSEFPRLRHAVNRHSIDEEVHLIPRYAHFQRIRARSGAIGLLDGGIWCFVHDGVC